MKWPFSPAATAIAAGTVVSAVAASWRFEVAGEAAYRAAGQDGRGFLFLLWHEALLPLLWHHRRQGVAIVVSEAQDGRYLAAYAERLGYRCLLGSSTRGGAKALLGAVRALEAGTTVAFTPDGPRGPRRVVKPGILAAAARSGAWVLPIHAEADRCWRLRSWDRFVVPRPFARVRIGYGAPFRVPAGSDLETAALDAAGRLTLVEREIAWRDAGATATG
jgi:lysophospholipid acyltransferase (LPLAT)-like uncharacterized protein